MAFKRRRTRGKSRRVSSRRRRKGSAGRKKTLRQRIGYRL